MGDGIAKFAKAVTYIRDNINKDFAIQQLAIYLLVSQNQGITMTEISDRLNMPQGTVSRNVKELTQYIDKFKNNCGYDLIRVEPDMVERRRLACYLSRKGNRLMKELEDILE